MPNLEEDDKKHEQKGTDKWLQSGEMIPSDAGKGIKEFCPSIYPSCDVFAQKEKVLKQHNMDLRKLMEHHGADSSGKRELKLDELMDMIPYLKIYLKVRAYGW